MPKSSGNSEKKKGRVENLKPWQPGQSGNPSGRPKGSRLISDTYLRLLSEKHPSDARGRTYAELLCTGMLNAAIKGKADAGREVTNRIEGLVLGEVEASESNFQLIIRPRPEGAAAPKPKEE